MKRSRGESAPEPLKPAELAAVAADDAAIDAAIEAMERDAVSWDITDPALAALGVLRADVTAELPQPSTFWGSAAAVNLNRARLRRTGKRSLVAASVAAVVLSAGSVAAAAAASGPTGPLGSLHRLIVGSQPTASQHAAKQVRLFLGEVSRDLAAGRLPAARAALQHAASWLTKVSPADQGDMPAQLSALQSRYADALAHDTTPGANGAGDNGATHSGGTGSGRPAEHKGDGGGQPGDGRGSGDGSDTHSGSTIRSHNDGSDESGSSGGSGDTGSSGTGSGDSSGNVSTGGDQQGKDGTDNSIDGGRSGGTDGSNSGGTDGSRDGGDGASIGQHSYGHSGSDG
jgi:hypothetical protein